MIFFSTLVCGQKKARGVAHARAIVFQIREVFPPVNTNMGIVPSYKDGGEVIFHDLHSKPFPSP